MRCDAADPRPHYRVRATLSLDPPQIEGTIDVGFTNPSRSASNARFLLFPNRFSTPDADLNDFNRAYVYPQQDFDAGRMEVVDAHDENGAVRVQPVSEPDLPAGCAVEVRPSDATRTLSLHFRTRIPHRFGSFGEFERQLTLIGGWYPYLAARDADGRWDVHAPPPLADFEVALAVPPGVEVVLNGRHFARDQGPARLTVTSAHYLSLIAAPEFLRSEVSVDGTHVVFLHRPAQRTSRVNPEPPPAEIMLATLHDVLAQRSPAVLPPGGELVVVEAPLRLSLTAAGEGAVVVSDRALKVHLLLRPFHELQVAQAVYAELLRPALSAREPEADYWWVSEGLAHELAKRFVAHTEPETRSVQDWIELFNIFAIVDRFESVPKIPFVDAFFDRVRVADPLHGEIATFNSSLPPGRVIFSKLREVVGENEFSAIIDRCLASPVPFRRCSSPSGRGTDVLQQWLKPYPPLNYRFESLALNQPQAGAFHHTLSIRREPSQRIVEPVTVRLRSIGGRSVDVRWDGSGDVGRLSADTPYRVWQAVIDPDRKLIEDRRDDNARPPTPQVVLDTAEVEISSTEFGISGLVVGRGRYDYGKDLAVAGFYTNRSIGATTGARAHWGAPIDATSYRHNLYGFYGFQALNSNFTDDRRPTVRTPGNLASLGVRYDYTNVFFYDNPTDERALRLYADWYDRGLGGDYNYADWGANVTLTHPLWSYRTLAAGEVLNGFSEPLGGSRVPNQGLYSLGGSRSIRGIGAEDELGRNILLVRGELRQQLYPEVDFNFLDVLVMRRAEVRVFADSGRVNNAAGRVYDVGKFALGVGTGFAIVYEFLGFFPSVAYIELATRADGGHGTGSVQFLFGTRQAF